MTKPVFEIDDLPPEPVADPGVEEPIDIMSWSKRLRRIVAGVLRTR